MFWYPRLDAYNLNFGIVQKATLITYEFTDVEYATTKDSTALTEGNKVMNSLFSWFVADK